MPDSPSVDKLSVAQVARELGITARRVRVLIERKNLPAVRFGERAWMIAPADLELVRDRKPGRPWPQKTAEAKPAARAKPAKKGRKRM